MTKLTKEEVKFQLEQIGYNKEFVVIFYKTLKKGQTVPEQRKMHCRMEPPKRDPAKNPDVVPVVDLEKGAWRSFRTDSVVYLGEH